MSQLQRILTLALCLATSTIIVAASANPPKIKQVKVRGYITAITSPNPFEIEDYRISRDESVALEFENEG